MRRGLPRGRSPLLGAPEKYRRSTKNVLSPSERELRASVSVGTIREPGRSRPGGAGSNDTLELLACKGSYGLDQPTLLKFRVHAARVLLHLGPLRHRVECGIRCPYRFGLLHDPDHAGLLCATAKRSGLSLDVSVLRPVYRRLRHHARDG